MPLMRRHVPAVQAVPEAASVVVANHTPEGAFVPVPSAPVALEPKAEAPKPVYTGRKKSDTDDDKMSKADWAAKDRRIGRAGLYQAALQSVGVLQYSPDVRTFEDYLKAVRKAAEDGLQFVNEAV